MKFTVLLLSFIFLQQTKGDGLHSFQLSSTELNLIAGEKAEIIFTSFLNSSNPTTVNLIKNRHGIIKLKPKTFIIPPEMNFFNQTIQITSLKSGKVEIEGHTDSNPDAIIFFRIIVAKSNFLIIIASVVGWIYFIAWSLSLYPQIWMIIQMKSVTGLSFDYLSLSFFGHLLYAVFNLALYFGKYFQDEYFRRHPHGLNPVELNDVFYCIHVLALSLITVICCFIFQRDNQKITKYAWSINGTFIFSLIIVAILCSFGKLHWFDLINTCNLIKVIGSLIKYVPQVYFNHKRKNLENQGVTTYQNNKESIKLTN
ncbi:hypothetical protein PVAND_015997 [Polypedilum vanderplanki]|uniref:Cystinosin-like protein n=1 Tax=Polypedilum vanderplanki TaxID=319348 RepID=A0A9J6BEL2_POLVA|nr:hypothetical protein PVAND_015997 [Polypedilum vanderplanki]